MVNVCECISHIVLGKGLVMAVTVGGFIMSYIKTKTLDLLLFYSAGEMDYKHHATENR